MWTQRLIALAPCVLLLAGCPSSETEDASTSESQVPPLADSYFVAVAPEGAVDVLAMRENAEPGEDVVVQGEVKDFVPGLAAFTIADLSLMSCADMEKDHCATPWDFCCEDPTKLQKGVATIEFHEDGALAEAQIQGTHGVDHLTDVIVKGTFQQDAAGNLKVIASSVHVLP